MQQYKQLDPTEPLNKSIPAMQKSLDTTASMFSGTAFPTENLFQGMPCYRTDLKTIFILRDVATKDWHGIINLNLTAGQAETDGNGDNIAETYLKMDEAGNLYLKKTDASSTYLTKAEAGNTYLTRTSAQNTYMTKTEANNTYETKASAKSHFNKIDYDSDAGTATFTTEGGASTKITLGKVKTVNGAGPDSNGNITVSTNAIASSDVSNANAWWVKFAGSPGLIIQGGSLSIPSASDGKFTFPVSVTNTLYQGFLSNAAHNSGNRNCCAVKSNNNSLTIYSGEEARCLFLVFRIGV